MSSNGNYPPGAGYDPEAPWKDGAETKRITVSVTYSKEFLLEVPKGCSPEGLTEFVRGAIISPRDILDSLAKTHPDPVNIYKGWEEDDFAVAE